MKSRYVLIILFAIYFFGSKANAQKDPSDYVNVFTGTSNSRWMAFPGATLPFGMVKLSPDNQDNVWNGGYEYTISSISGFSLLHSMSLSGLSIMPTIGSSSANEGWIKSYPGPADGPFGGMWTAGYRSRFKKETEKASPGYYSVFLLDYKIQAELTSTMRCGMMRFTYPKAKESHIILNFDSPVEEKSDILKTYFEKVSDTEVKGSITQKNNYVPEYTVYFVIRLNKKLKSIDAWQSEAYKGSDKNYGTQWRQTRKVQKDVKTFIGSSESGVVLNFETSDNEAVIVQTGLSFVSQDQAQLNLDTEMKSYNFDFDQVVKDNKSIWNNLLGKVEVFSEKKDDLVKFYTNLYRSYTGKSVMNDVDGKYLDACHNVQQLKGNSKAVYSSDALWGIQWNLTPLWTLLNPDIASEWVNAFLELSDKGGWIPAAPVALGYSPIMGAQHQNSLIISSYQKGIRSFDVNKAYKAILHDYTVPGHEYSCGGFVGDRHLKTYLDLGYVTDETGPASSTMEYAYDDWCLAQFAKALNKGDVYKQFLNRSKNYKKIFDPNVKLVRQKHTNGSWVLPFDSLKYGTEGGWNGKGFMEGTPFQYSFFVPQDINGMVKLMGKDTFIHRLEYGFENNLFDLGNEPCLETPFLFNYIGKPWLTQKYVRQIVNNMYDSSPYQGWIGEEDEGQLGSYFVLISMGLFEMDGGCSTQPKYDITSPLFDKIIIHLDKTYYSGKDFTIEAHNNSTSNLYIQSAKLNGKLLTHPWIYHSDLIKGGNLIFEMGSEPNKNWGNKPEDSPLNKE